jgi:hypothetical protein
MRRKRGVVAGVPDNLSLHRGKLIGLELKSPQGKRSPSQRATRRAPLNARIHAWWECKSANAAMWAKSGAAFRAIVREDGTVEHWKSVGVYLPLAASAEVARGANEVRRSAACSSIHAVREPGYFWDTVQRPDD